MLGLFRAPRAFFVRDFRVEASYKVGFALALVGALLDVAIYYFITRVFGDTIAPYLQAYGGNYFAFVVIGVAFTDYLGVGINSVANGVRGEQRAGTFELMLLTPTRLPVILVSQTLWSYAFTTMTVLAYLIAGVALGMRLETANVPVALLSLACALASFTALGFCATSLVILIKRGNPFGWAIRASSILLSGVFYPVDVLPGWLRVIGQLLPLTHALELLRRSLLMGEGLRELWPELVTLAGLTIVLLPLGWLACHLAIRIARIDGSLSHQ